MTTYLTPKLVAERLVLDVDAVTALIRSGDLSASNVGRGRKKPRYRIDLADLDRFLDSRRTGQAPKSKQRTIEVKTDRVQYYPET
jgi:excisionase family DNA binding protein